MVLVANARAIPLSADDGDDHRPISRREGRSELPDSALGDPARLAASARSPTRPPTRVLTAGSYPASRDGSNPCVNAAQAPGE